jgi:hypothetical protein
MARLPAKGRKVAGQRVPAIGASFDGDLGDIPPLEHRAERGETRLSKGPGKREVPGEVRLGGRAHGMEGLAHVKASELLRGDGLAPRGRDGSLEQIEALVEVAPGVDREHARHPEVMQGVMGGRPAPPAAARPASFEVSAAHGAGRLDRRFHLREHFRVLAQPPRPAELARMVVEHRAAPEREKRRRDEARGVRPVLEEQPSAIDQAVEARAVVRSEPVPDRQVMGAVDDVDRIELDAADVLGEANEAGRRERDGPRAVQVLPLEEEGPNGSDRERAGGHSRGDYTAAPSRPFPV